MPSDRQSGIGAQGTLDVSGAADERDPGVEVTRRRHRPVDDDRGRVVTTHGVDCNPDLQRPASYSSSTALTGRAL